MKIDKEKERVDKMKRGWIKAYVTSCEKQGNIYFPSYKIKLEVKIEKKNNENNS